MSGVSDRGFALSGKVIWRARYSDVLCEPNSDPQLSSGDKVLRAGTYTMSSGRRIVRDPLAGT